MHFSCAPVFTLALANHSFTRLTTSKGVAFAIIQAIACILHLPLRGPLMGVLLERKSQVIFFTASSVKEDGKAREIVIESRPLYVVVQLNGSKEKYPVAWEAVYELAKKRHAENLRIEARSTERESLRRKKTA